MCLSEVQGLSSAERLAFPELACWRVPVQRASPTFALDDLHIDTPPITHQHLRH